jgi:Cdc6-like AAA superfamily ATPase
MNYEEEIKIDVDALDLEWRDQPVLMMTYARQAAEARRHLDQMKEKIELVKAELDREIRTKPERYGIEKITENAVQNTIITLPEFKKASKILLDAKFDADIAQSAVIAISQRKDALENLVRLHGQQYFAGPKVPRDLSFEAQKREKQLRVNKEIGSSLSRGNK